MSELDERGVPPYPLRAMLPICSTLLTLETRSITDNELAVASIESTAFEFRRATTAWFAGGDSDSDPPDVLV